MGTRLWSKSGWTCVEANINTEESELRLYLFRRYPEKATDTGRKLKRQPPSPIDPKITDEEEMRGIATKELKTVTTALKNGFPALVMEEEAVNLSAQHHILLQLTLG
ncbi:hypothetical protein CEP51_006041 [Fusarium floridanum]|uniref:Uncharacterized protein n=1 Tax=Fusarium floridanum TaxID=1325733 RepID=A0A428RUA6_9HYPO|nr:hypothetical protein CEP51_006041 [Fusarium floridanum]